MKKTTTGIGAAVRIASVILSALLLFTQSIAVGAATDNFGYTTYQTYKEYTAGHTGAQNASAAYSVSANQLADAAALKEFGGKAAVQLGENESITAEVSIESAGLYKLSLNYYPQPGESASVKLQLLLDGEIPFKEAETITLKREWDGNTDDKYDTQGNQIRLPSPEKPVWITKALTDSGGLLNEPFSFFLSEGTHRITLLVYQNTLNLGEISLSAPDSAQSYEQLCKTYSDYSPAQKNCLVQAENYAAKSDRSIVTVNDKTSPSTTPYAGTTVVYNAVGGDNWKTAGEWIEWEADVPEDGLYSVALRFKQSTKTGALSYRSMTVDGKIPFAEAGMLSFGYDGSWQTATLGDGESPYLLYLTKGVHTIRLEATLGKYADVIADVSTALNALNDIYTNIVMVTGPQPDTDRDYQFEKTIPEVLKVIKMSSATLKEIEKRLDQLTGNTGGESTAVVRRLHISLDKMLDDPDTISERLGDFLSDITSLGTWINNSRSQPLMLDYIMLCGSDETPREKNGIFSVISFYVRQFIYSFQMDYANVGNRSINVDKKIRVWIGTGRDQTDIIRQLINEDFTPNSGIGVNVQLVNAGALTPATLAGNGPDAYLSIAQNQPVEYALRHAVADLSKFEDIDEICKRFYPASLTSFQLDGSLYALPETMVYPVMFYRKDILSELGIKRGDLLTWESLLQKVLPELNMNSFDFGLPTGIASFGTLLYQNGGSFYNSDNTASGFNTSESVSAFELMTSLYTDYGIPVSFDFANRFRSGQMPLAINEYSAYNQLLIFAPEIAGLWGMLPLPGFESADGTINNTSLCTVTGAVILNTSVNKEEAWSFLKWWTDGAVQARYARELETVMGTGARYASANIEAMESVEWDRDIKKALSEQQKSLVGMPCIAGGYYTSRNYDFAFRDVVFKGKNLRETLSDAAESITAEIGDKRSEFYINR